MVEHSEIPSYRTMRQQTLSSVLRVLKPRPDVGGDGAKSAYPTFSPELKNDDDEK